VTNLKSLRTEPFDLSGRVALVTGGNGGIGRSIAMGLAQAGAAVAVLARNEEKNQSVMGELPGTGCSCFSRESRSQRAWPTTACPGKG
jgi:2-dehydro-3-deoxy-D-gluconate 5-dehydrogenase